MVRKNCDCDNDNSERGIYTAGYIDVVDGSILDDLCEAPGGHFNSLLPYINISKKLFPCINLYII